MTRKLLLPALYDEKLTICSPDMMSKSDRLDGKQKLHETWLVSLRVVSSVRIIRHFFSLLLHVYLLLYEKTFLTHLLTQLDATQSYIEQALTMNMGVIDVNIPEHITIEESTAYSSSLDPSSYPAHPSLYANTSLEYAAKNNDLARREGEKLATYLWDNYIEPFDFDHIIIIGVGHAFHAIARAITESDTIHESIPAIVSFVSEQPVRGLSNPNNPWLGSWYRDHSRVYVTHDHNVWAREKKSKRYGRTIRAPEGLRGLNGMMKYYKDEVWTWIRDVIGEDEDEENEEDGSASDGRADIRAEDELMTGVTIGAGANATRMA